MFFAGISLGGTINLPIVSAVKINNAPARAENGINTLWSEPTNCLEICGTSNPTKAITPAIAVDTAAKILQWQK